MRTGWLLVAAGIISAAASPLGAEEDPLHREAGEALRRAVHFFRTRVSTRGGYLWRYSEDLERREGERSATRTTVWVQPPGTPSVGRAYLEAHALIRETYLLDAARETAGALVEGQLRSGGWDYRIEFDPALRRLHAYRTDPPADRQRDTTTLDDNNTQEALRFLMLVDRALDFKDERIHEAAHHALKCLLRAQYPNGAWPQRYAEFPDAEKFPVKPFPLKKAGYPKSWSRTWPKASYQSFFTFNDNTLSDMIDTFFLAERIYDRKDLRAAAERAGDFILLAQMPEPQPGWAQQYDADMHPSWARKFEPPAITGGESRGVILTLLRLYTETGHQRFLEPIPRALAYYKRSVLPDGKLARFYELETNRPIFFTREYELTTSDADLPTHYSFKQTNWVNTVEKRYRKVLDQESRDRRGPETAAVSPAGSAPVSRRIVRELIQGLDRRGAWVEEGKLSNQGSGDATTRVITSRTFIRNVGILSRYLAGSASLRQAPGPAPRGQDRSAGGEPKSADQAGRSGRRP